MFLIPMIDERLNEFAGTGLFSKLDFKSGYHQICHERKRHHEESSRTYESHYEFLVVSAIWPYKCTLHIPRLNVQHLRKVFQVSTVKGSHTGGK